jgi:acyl-CoA thioesterase FadM
MNLYLRLFLLLFRLAGLASKPLLDESRASFRVLPNDCDFNVHMNNGRYLTFMDLGRLHLMRQTRILGHIVRNRWRPVLAGAEINFLRPIAPFQKFDLATRIVTWDEKYFYLEQRFESRGALCAHGFVKGLFLGRGRKIANSEITAAIGWQGAAPPLPEALRIWSELGSVKKQSAA